MIGDPAYAGVEIGIVEHRAENGTGNDVSGKYVANLHWDGNEEDHKTTGSVIIQASDPNPDNTLEYSATGTI